MLHSNPHMLPKVRSEALTKSAQEMPCTLRIGSFVGIPCASQDTNIMAHLPVMGKGTSTKVSDLFMACACHSCHDLLDDRNQKGGRIRDQYPAAYGQRLLLALAETQSRWLGLGLIEVKGGRIIV